MSNFLAKSWEIVSAKRLTVLACAATMSVGVVAAQQLCVLERKKQNPLEAMAV